LIETRFVEDSEGLASLADRLRGEPAVALDTEFLTERYFYAKLCLIQIGTPSLLATVDPLSCKDLTPLSEVLASGVELVLHAGAQDLAILRRQFGALPEKVFDTQIAAAFLGYGHSIGYARLVEKCSSVRLKRSQAYTDWSKRPLDSVQLEYALDDVRYLLPIRDRLTAELDRLGRTTWAHDEFAGARQTGLADAEPREQWRRLSGLRATGRRELGVLQELAAWREEEARRRDIPRQRVIPDRVLLEIGRRMPAQAAELEGTRGLHPRELQRSGAAIIAALERGRERPADDLPKSRRRSRLDDNPDIAVAAALAHTYLKTRARDLGLSSQLLANRKDLEILVRLLAENGDPDAALAGEGPDGGRNIRLLEGWRREVAGDEILRLLAGELALRVRVRKGGVEVMIEDREGPPPG